MDLSDGLADDDPSQLTFVPTPQDINRDILDQADQFIVVARADAVGLTRLAHTLFDAEENGLRPQLLVINKARRSGTGGSIERPIDSVLSSIVPDLPRVIIEDALWLIRPLWMLRRWLRNLRRRVLLSRSIRS